MLWLSKDNIVTKNTIVTNKEYLKFLSRLRDDLSRESFYDFVKITREARDKVCFSIHSDDWIYKYNDKGVKGTRRIYEIEHYRNPYFVVLQMIREALIVDNRYKPVGNINLSRLLYVKDSHDKKSLEENLSQLEEMLEEGNFDEQYSPEDFKVLEYYVRNIIELLQFGEVERYIINGDYVSSISRNEETGKTPQNIRHEVLGLMPTAQNNQRVVDLTTKIKQRRK